MRGRHTTRRFLAALALTLAWLATQPLAAQHVSGAAAGRVIDVTGAALADAAIVFVHLETGATAAATTDRTGRYRVAALPAGEYRVEVTVTGFMRHTRALRITAGETATLDMQLQIAHATEDVVVVASPLQRHSAELGGVVERAQVLALPVNGRSFEQLALLEPGVVATNARETSVLYQHGLKININGAGSRSNTFLLDGTSVADLYNNGLGSAAGMFLGLEAVREFQVLTNAFDASHGGGSGGVMSIVTKSGSSDLHGSAFATVRDARLDAKGYFDAAKPALRRQQAGFSLGGPIVRDRAVFFATGEWLHESRGVTQISTVPSLTARNGQLADPQNPGQTIAVNPAVRPYLDLFPLPNGADLGGGLAEYRFAAVRPTREGFGQARADVHASERNNLFARITADRARKTEPANFPGAGVDWRSESRFLTIEDRHVQSEHLVNTVRASYSLTDLEQTDTTGRDGADGLAIIAGRGTPHLAIGGMPTFGSLVSPHTRARQRLLAVSDDVTLSRGAHLLQAGTLVEAFAALVDFQIFWPGRYSFPGIAQFLAGRPTVLSLALPGSDSARDLSTRQFGAYLQDEVRLSPAITLNAGVRWEFATAPTEAQDRLVALVDPRHDVQPLAGSLLRTHKANIGPRGGITWALGARGRTVLRAGAGVFYDINTLPFVAQTVGTNPPFFNQVTIRNPTFPQPALPASPELSLGIPAYDWRTPRLVHMNGAVERELPGGLTLTAAYAGSRGSHVVRSGDLNAPLPTIRADGSTIFLAGPRRNPAFGAIAYRAPDGTSRYDALQVKLARRSHRGLALEAGYTLARTIDDSQGTVPTESDGSVTQWMDPDSRATDRGPADFDRRHNLVAHAIWSPGRTATAPALVRALANDWTIASIVTLRSGTPFTVGIQGDYSRTLVRVSVDRPNLRAGVSPDDVILGGADRYFDPSAFVLQEPGTFGNVGRNSLTAPGIASLDLACVKTLALGAAGKGRRLELRVDVFNAFNRVNLGMPQRIVFAGVRQDEAPISTAGRIVSTTTGPRELQISLRTSW
jgi:hypothetical protein